MRREHDLVLVGATGFVGRLTAAYLARRAPSGTTIALAGRSRARLESLRAELGVGWPVLVVDSTSPAASATLALSASVVATTVGPYARLGGALVAACASAGTDYADLTGELLFVRDSVDRQHAVAVATGARIVHACGFDSVPSDLAVLLTADRARADGAGTLTDTTLVLAAIRGGVSGGTIDSLRHQVDSSRSDRALRAVLADPYALSPDREDEPDRMGGPAGAGGSGRDRTAGDAVGVRREGGRWTAPFVMAPFNTRIVRRSNALSGWSYGRTFAYREVMGFGSSPVAPLAAAVTAGGLLAVGAGLALTPARLLDRVLPAPGQGPGEEARENGHFRMELTAATISGARYTTTVAAQGDPGYAATAVMLGESALCLVADRAAAPPDPAAPPGVAMAAPAHQADGRSVPAAGVLTPATALGTALADRLIAAGFTLTTEQV